MIDNYLGTGTRYAGQTMRGLYYDAFKAAIEPALHSVITGTAPAGATLTLTKAYTLDTSSTTWPTGTAAEVRAFPNAINARRSPCPRTGSSSGTSTRRCARASTRDQFVDESYTLTCTARRRHGAGDDDGQDRPRRSSSTARSARRAGSAARCPATLSLTLGAPATFGAFTPGVAKEYDASTTANVISTAGDATL